MKEKVVVMVCCLVLLFAAGACSKKGEQPAPRGRAAMPTRGMVPQQGMSGRGPQVIVPKGEMTVSVPDSVKGKWKAVILAVEDKDVKKTRNYTIGLRSDFKVPNSDLKITVGDFLPDFRMNGLTLTSASNEPKNPALCIRVFEGSRQIFPEAGKKWGWLFSKFPTMHPFEHPKYAIVLKKGVRQD